MLNDVDEALTENVAQNAEDRLKLREKNLHPTLMYAMQMT